jgi:DNA-binding LacI/PurR family transcriptional regulator
MSDYHSAMIGERAAADKGNKAYPWLLDWLADRHVEPGTQTSIQELSSQSGFPPSAIRKALKVVERDGYIRGLRGRGILIKKLPDRQVIYEVGLITESCGQSQTGKFLQGFANRLGERVPNLMVSFRVLLPDGVHQAEGRTGFYLPQSLRAVVVFPAASAAVQKKIGAAIAKLEIPVIPIESSTFGVPAIATDAEAAGRLTAAHLVQQLSRFGRPHAPIYIVSDRALDESESWLRGCKSVFAGYPDLNWSFTRHVRYPTEPRSVDRIRLWNRNRGAGEYLPRLSGHAAGRMLGALLLEEHGLLDKPAGQPEFAVVCTSHRVTQGLLSSFCRFGICVPQAALIACLEQGPLTSWDWQITRIESDWEGLGREAAGSLLKRAFPPSVGDRDPQLVAPSILKRRSTHSWIHTLWRSMPGSAAIKKTSGRLAYGNPMLEEVVGSPLHQIHDRLPSEYWGSAIGGPIEQYDRQVIESMQSYVSTEWLPVHGRHAQKRRFNLRFPMEVHGEKYIGTLGLDYREVNGKYEREFVHPSFEHDNTISDPPDDVMEAFFEQLPASVSIGYPDPSRNGHSSAHRAIWLYANSTFRASGENVDVTGRLIGSDLGALYMNETATQLLSLTLTEHPTAVSRDFRSIRFYLVDDFLMIAAKVVIGFHKNILDWIREMVTDGDAPYQVAPEALSVSEEPYVGWTIRQSRVS